MFSRYNLFKRQFLIHKESQLSLAFYFLFLHLAIMGILYILLQETVGVVLEDYKNATGLSTQIGILSEQINKDIKIIFLIFSVTATPIFFYSIIVLTNRIVGPLYRYQKLLKALKNGEKISLQQARKEDFFSDFYQDLNDYIQKNEER